MILGKDLNKLRTRRFYVVMLNFFCFVLFCNPIFTKHRPISPNPTLIPEPKLVRNVFGSKTAASDDDLLADFVTQFFHKRQTDCNVAHRWRFFFFSFLISPSTFVCYAAWTHARTHTQDFNKRTRLLCFLCEIRSHAVSTGHLGLMFTLEPRVENNSGWSHTEALGSPALKVRIYIYTPAPSNI